jgi:hypothetical protein
MNADTEHGFTFVTHWQRDDVNAGNAVRDFWLAESALGAGIEPAERIREVVLHARAPGGAIAAVCTAVPMTMPRIGQPMYYYRCFVGKNWRGARLVFTLLIHAFDVLEEHARANGFPCIGVLLELENARFGKALRAPVWPGSGFVYAGRSGRGLDLRVRYFRGARLKDASAKT